MRDVEHERDFHPTVIAHQGRSLSITILAGLHILQSLVLLGIGFPLVIDVEWIHLDPTVAVRYLPLVVFDPLFSGVVLVVLGLVGLFTALALVRLARWAWMLAMILQGAGLVAGLYAYASGKPNYVGMLAGVILVFYLNQEDVRNIFREQHTAADDPWTKP